MSTSVNDIQNFSRALLGRLETIRELHLSSPVRFTDYFPEELEQFREECLEVQ